MREGGGFVFSEPKNYQCVSAWLRYGLQYIRGRQLLLGMRFAASATGTAEVAVVGRASPWATKELVVGRHTVVVTASRYLH